LKKKVFTLVINRVESSRFLIKARLPQGSSLSLVLFLLYNKELLCIANRPNLKIKKNFLDLVHLFSEIYQKLRAF
jgi:hypothetical protein